ncbi:MAG: ABC transporter ATP-binding protein [Shewanella sp.]
MNHQALSAGSSHAPHEAVIQVSELCKCYGRFHALTDIHFELFSGQMLALLGHNGAGKSTLLKLILGLITPTSGHIQVQGRRVGQASARSGNSIGYLPENVSFYDNMTAAELLGYFAKLKGVAPAKVHQLLGEFGLGAAQDRRIGTFSKGMRQRLGLAQAILAEPKVLLLDEPTVGLDPLASDFLYQKMAELKAKGCGIMICTHELGLVQAQMDRALILGKGKMLASGQLTALREGAALPVQVTLHSLTPAQQQQLGHDPLLAPFIVPSAFGEARLSVPLAHKSAVLQQLLHGIQTDEFSLELASLQDIFHFYMDKLNDPVMAPERVVPPSQGQRPENGSQFGAREACK